MRLAFYGRTGPHPSPEGVARALAEQVEVAGAIARGGGHEIVVEFFDVGVARGAPLARRPRAAAMFLELADRAGRRFDGIVVGQAPDAVSGERCRGVVGPLLDHHGVVVLAPEPQLGDGPAEPGPLREPRRRDGLRRRLRRPAA
ncbi:hypothetical protein DNL40_14135 [Xylanimonas oleitrophica]|uniref:Resolvase/invertase-type recombinase catalytic domain-containing protein n=1 Tax=Xylanimonas oleitrophica TaxID=2607479 RepID=A0A2W5YCP5_9MICO|nr:hypothetical protein [Xylanimonas oleitrophica]PZR51951.1 hypothetical protein DNL40_14135 [Xylanimonas oleitrophica]